ncbi:PD-(D/E)XK nuclease family protein [Paracoccus thiocyanatus]|uniref:PD-(D/E)XK nuclease family protein n=1 Tax=Paracoccus thiocyanatus TaxID=34006 RepID=UPI0026B368A7
MLFGTRLHLLLEHLPGRDPAHWPALARDVLADAEGGLPASDELAALLTEARAVIEAPALAQVFALSEAAEVMAEVALAAPLPGIGILTGAVDRLVIEPGRIVAVDYKSNREVPGKPQAVPLGILRQMAAYRAALRLIWPDRRVEVAVLWTAARSLMALPDELLDGVMAGLDPNRPRA